MKLDLRSSGGRLATLAVVSLVCVAPKAVAKPPIEYFSRCRSLGSCRPRPAAVGRKAGATRARTLALPARLGRGRSIVGVVAITS
jgi:hypothetical protein